MFRHICIVLLYYNASINPSLGSEHSNLFKSNTVNIICNVWIIKWKHL